MTPTSTLRDVSWRDIAVLAAMERELFPTDAWTEVTWWGELALRPRRRYVALTTVDPAEPAEGRVPAAERILGYAGVTVGGELADVMTVAVASEGRGQGLGDRLMRWLVAEARASGAAYLMLEVRADNLAARRLYERHGLAVLTVRRRYYQPGDVDALVMRGALGDST